MYVNICRCMYMYMYMYRENKFQLYNHYDLVKILCELCSMYWIFTLENAFSSLSSL